MSNKTVKQEVEHAIEAYNKMSPEAARQYTECFTLTVSMQLNKEVYDDYKNS